jgi:hypothetical protein
MARWSSGSTTPSSAAGARASRPAASIVTLCDPPTGSSSKPVACAGLSLMVSVPIPWGGWTWSLPFLTILAPSARWSEANGRRHKTLTNWAKQAILQTRRWLPNRRLVVGDGGFAALDLLAAVRGHVCMVTRLRLDASLFRPAPKRRRGQRGRTPLKGRDHHNSLKFSKSSVPDAMSRCLNCGKPSPDPNSGPDLGGQLG